MTVAITRDLRNRRFWRGITNHSLVALGFLAATLGLFDLFVPDTLGDFDLPEIILVPLGALVYAGWRSWPRPIEQEFARPSTKIRLVTGDLFDQDTNVVVGMSDFFDIETPHIISINSVQGQFLSRIYQNDAHALRADLATALSGITPVETGVTKPGEQDRYALGTVATVRHQRKQYYCVAYTRMDVNNNVSSSIGILWEALAKLWDEVRRTSNGDPVSAPVVGLGQSGMSTILPMQDAIRFLILSFMFASRSSRVCDELTVVVRTQDEARVDMLEIQEFLRSLRMT